MANSTAGFQSSRGLAQDFCQALASKHGRQQHHPMQFRSVKDSASIEFFAFEAEIAVLDHKIYQASLSFNIEP